MAFAAAVFGLPGLVWIVSSDDAMRWWLANERVARRVWRELLVGERPLLAVGVAAAAVAAAGLAVASMSARGRRLFERRPFAGTPSVRRGVPAPAPAPTPVGDSPASPAGPGPSMRAQSRGRLGRVPRTSVGRLWLFLDHLPAKAIPAVWLVLCPLCFWIHWSVITPSLHGRTPWERLGQALSMVGFLGVLGSANAALRLQRAVGEATTLPRSVLFPQPRSRALRNRLFSLVASAAPAVVCLTLFFSLGSWHDLTPAGLPAQIAALTLCATALLFWHAAFRHVDQFSFPGLGRWVRITLIPAFFLAWMGSCAVHSGEAMGPPGEGGPGVYITIGGLMTLAGAVACVLALRLSHRWDLTTR